jgi:hypothetical protein
MDEDQKKALQTELAGIMDTIQTLGLERLDPSTSANSVILALMNIILQALYAHGDIETIDSIKNIFGEMCDAVKTRITVVEEVKDDKLD